MERAPGLDLGEIAQEVGALSEFAAPIEPNSRGAAGSGSASPQSEMILDPRIVPEGRHDGLRHVLEALDRAERIVLTTHVNADGDGAGSEAALATWLASQGKRVRIINPTPFPDGFRHLVSDPEWIVDAGSAASARELAEAELFVVVDTSEAKRLGKLPKSFGDRPVAVIDHHPAGDTGVGGFGVQDPAASATGELIYDLLQIAGAGGDAWPEPVAEAIYTAIVTDTGSFRFANTTPRAHAIAGEMIARGVDPEAVYRRLFGSVPLRRIELVRAALAELVADPEWPVTWITVPRETVESVGATSEDLDGIVEYARSIEGTEVALLFREVADGSTKVSFRSNGIVDVNAIARQFGGGGHVKASGALIGEGLERARARVIEAVRETLRSLEMRRQIR